MHSNSHRASIIFPSNSNTEPMEPHHNKAFKSKMKKKKKNTTMEHAFNFHGSLEKPWKLVTTNKVVYLIILYIF